MDAYVVVVNHIILLQHYTAASLLRIQTLSIAYTLAVRITLPVLVETCHPCVMLLPEGAIEGTSAVACRTARDGKVKLCRVNRTVSCPSTILQTI